METSHFKCLKVYQKSHIFTSKVVQQDIKTLPRYDTTIRVLYSSLNYKDALSATGNRGVTKNYPHTPGIDAVGYVESSSCRDFKKQQPVIVTGYDLGMNTHGGYSQFISVPHDWVVPLPDGMTEKESMILGTAGFTAALAVYKMELNGQKKRNGKIIVTGATGGVGSLSIALLAKLGYEVMASTGKEAEYHYLKSLGAKECIHRKELETVQDKKVVRSRWAGGIDTVGGDILVNVLKATALNGNISNCGLVASPYIHNLSVIPFIINGVNLLGVNSAQCPRNIRELLWKKLAKEWKIEYKNIKIHICSLEELPSYFGKILKGEIKGRVVVQV